MLCLGLMRGFWDGTSDSVKVIRIPKEESITANEILSKAIKKGKENKIYGLLTDRYFQQQINIHTMDSSNKTLLMHAAWYGNANIVDFLIQYANPYDSRLMETNINLAFLTAADSYRAEVEVMDLLLQWGAYINVANEAGCTALMIAAMGYNKNILKFLIDSGANLDVQNENERTALMEAVRYGHRGMAEILLENGADPNVQNIHNESALTIATKYADEDSIHLLHQYGAIR